MGSLLHRDEPMHGKDLDEALVILLQLKLFSTDSEFGPNGQMLTSHWNSYP